MKKGQRTAVIVGLIICVLVGAGVLTYLFTSGFFNVSICPASATVTSQPSVLDHATFSVTVEVRSSLRPCRGRGLAGLGESGQHRP